MSKKSTPEDGRQLLINQFNTFVGQKTSVYDLLTTFPIPDAFWTAPASSTGKYHPTFSLGNGGLMRHTLLNMYWCSRYGRILGASDGEIAVSICAAALHDTYKGGYDVTWNTTVADHPYIAAAEIRKFTTLSKNISDGQRQRWFEVADAVWTHMGMFSSSPRNPKPGEFVPVALDEMSVPGRILALSDYAAAQKVYDDLPSVIGTSYEPAPKGSQDE